MTMPMQPAQPWAQAGTQPRIAIIGAGMSGIAAVVKLRKAGYTDLTVFEKADRVGGTWRENTYPGLSCDVPSRWYSFSFNLKHDWTHRFSYGPEIQAYMEETADKFNVTDIVRFDTPVTDLVYEGPHWRLTTGDGRTEVFDVVISATGVLHHPALPDIDGLDSFAGAQFHTARWDHSVELEGKRVGIIGTGSTAIQIVPAIVERVARLSLFQRTPQWILPIPNPPYSEQDKATYRAHPERLAEAYQAWSDRIRTTIARAVVGDAEQMAKIADACRANLADNVTDAALREKLTPDYAVACKRLIMSEQFYPAIQKPNAELVTTGIRAIERSGVRTADDRLHELDVLVYATGFDAHRFVRAMNIVGEDGLALDDAWRDATRAHRSMSIPGFPNFFMMIGPNSPIGNFSLIMVAEAQIRYILDLVAEVRDGRCRALQPRAEACAAFNEAIRGAMGKTVWVSGCRSWYLDRNGQPILWPWSLERFQEEMRAPDLDEYQLAG